MSIQNIRINLLSGKEYIVEFDPLNQNQNLFDSCYLKIKDDFPFIEPFDIQLSFTKNDIFYSFNIFELDIYKLDIYDTIFNYQLTLLNYDRKFKYYYNDKPNYYIIEFGLSSIIELIYIYHISDNYKKNPKLKIFDYNSNELYYECDFRIRKYYGHDDEFDCIIKKNDINDMNITELIFMISIT
jgi:hypothetical protein